MTKPTGKPRGRPKGEAYVTIMARVPLYMQQLMQASASLHGATISELLRHWIDAGLQQEAPTLVSDSNRDTQPAILSNKNGDTQAVILSDNNGEMQPPIMSDNKRDTQPCILSDDKEAPQDSPILSDAKADIDCGPCKRLHIWGTTGLSLFVIASGQCPRCVAQNQKDARARKRAAKAAANLEQHSTARV